MSITYLKTSSTSTQNTVKAWFTNSGSAPFKSLSSGLAFPYPVKYGWPNPLRPLQRLKQFLYCNDVKFVLKSLKTGKAKDLYNMPNELFKPEVAGTDLILALTKLMNRIKDELHFPVPMNICNVTNLYKNKGLKKHFNSYRGIFRTPVLRNILDKRPCKIWAPYSGH